MEPSPFAANSGTLMQAGITVWPVGSLLQAITESLEARFNPVAVRGEVSGFSRATSGHCYFSLKDDRGQVRCALFRRAATLLDFTPRDGQLVEIRGRLGVYEPRGELQMVVESMRQAGDGLLFEQFLRLKERLAAEGLFAAQRKRSMPHMARAIGVITSLGAAALHDVVSVLSRRVPHTQVVIYAASVQGSQAAGDLRRALALAVARHEVDVLLVVRGGGSLEDLWAFNDEGLSRDIAASPIPIVTGIGHETDFTLADFCADLRAPTPTAAAELCAQAQAVWVDVLDQIDARLANAVAQQLETAGQRLDLATSKISRPTRVVLDQQTRLSDTARRFENSTRSQLRDKALQAERLADLPVRFTHAFRLASQRLDQCELRMELLDPRRVLTRGYAWLTDVHGKPVSRALSLHPGQAVRATLSDGTVDLTVTPPRLI